MGQKNKIDLELGSGIKKNLIAEIKKNIEKYFRRAISSKKAKDAWIKDEHVANHKGMG